MFHIGRVLRWRSARRTPSTICPLPWVNLSLDVDGSSRPCCKFAHLESGSPYQLANLRDSTLEGTWNSAAMQRLRRDFRSGKQPTECSACWDEERAGIASFRQTYLADRGITDDIAFDELAPEAPKALDLKLSNSCNLKCRICGPVASSLWLSEELRADTAQDREHLLRNKDYFRSHKITDRPAERSTLRSWIPHLEHIELTGGEPMLSAENRELLDLVVDDGQPERVTLLLTTNATVIDERILSHLPRFKSVTISLSIDDIGERFEYQRAPARWDVVQANIDRYAGQASPSCHIYTNCSVSVFNAWYLTEYLRWMADRYADGQVTFNLNLVHGPRHFCVQVLPREVKRAVGARLRSLMDEGGQPSSVRRQLSELIEFMSASGPGDGDEWAAAVETIIERDRIRSESFSAALPELYGALVDAASWPQDGGVAVRAPRRIEAS